MTFRGDWVPQTQSCDTALKLVVERDRLVLKNGIETQTFKDIDVCHSCVGGSKSDGIEIWLIPAFGKLAAARGQAMRDALVRLGLDSRRLFLEYIHRINRLKEKPEFYNTLTDNCTTGIWMNT
ncbi:MAG: DUF4105 domain-containing protein, partial [Hyphomicrobiaceae bacterium]